MVGIAPKRNVSARNVFGAKRSVFELYDNRLHVRKNQNRMKVASRAT